MSAFDIFEQLEPAQRCVRARMCVTYVTVAVLRVAVLRVWL